MDRPVKPTSLETHPSHPDPGSDRARSTESVLRWRQRYPYQRGARPSS